MISCRNVETWKTLNVLIGIRPLHTLFRLECWRMKVHHEQCWLGWASRTPLGGTWHRWILHVRAEINWAQFEILLINDQLPASARFDTLHHSNNMSLPIHWALSSVQAKNTQVLNLCLCRTCKLRCNLKVLNYDCTTVVELATRSPHFSSPVTNWKATEQDCNLLNWFKELARSCAQPIATVLEPLTAGRKGNQSACNNQMIMKLFAHFFTFSVLQILCLFTCDFIVLHCLECNAIHSQR